MGNQFASIMGRWATAFLVAGLGLTGSASAALMDRGGGMLYDTVLNITWLQDANYAKTSGYDADGLMNWSAATTWAANLVYGGFDDWRLPIASPVNGSTWNYANSNDGTTDFAYNITSPNSEMSYMYYVNLGLKGVNSPSGVFQPDWGVFGNGTVGGPATIGLVHDLMSFRPYWSGTTSERDPFENAWFFNIGKGGQSETVQSTEWFAWAVRSGDVSAAVPEPASLLLLFLGLAGLGFNRRRNA